MDQRFLKITYHSSGSKKMNAYLKMPSPTYRVLKKEIEMYLFEERQQPRCEIRTFWIDEDQDEIEIISQPDYDIFMSKRSERHHLQVAAIGVATEVATSSANNTSSAPDQSKVPPAAGSYEFAVHDRVECDGCLMAPIMGFRYKCIQCPNFDLCQNCEAKHVHSEHMMVRMPTKNCPGVVEAYVTGRTSGRRRGKRSKGDGCPFVVKNGISVIVEDEAENSGVASGEQSSSSPAAGCKERHHGRKHGHHRHHRNNFLSHLYEMMHDLAEGGGAAAAEAATGETTTSTTTTNGPSTTSTTISTGFENLESNVNATATAAHIAAQKAHETAVKTAEIAARVVHETALQSSKNLTEKDAAPSTAADAGEQGTDKIPDNKMNDDTKSQQYQSTSQHNQSTTIPVLPSPTLESIAQFLDPQYMKTGIQILNNFSDMFAKMLDPIDGAEAGGAAFSTFAENSRKNSTTSTKSSDSSNLNSMESNKKSEKPSEKSMEKQEHTPESKQAESDVSSNIEIDDLGSDSENDSVSETFIKLDAPKEPKANIATTAANSSNTTPPQSLNKSNVMDFAQLSANLKAHIAEEAKTNSIVTPTEIAIAATEELLNKETSNATPKMSTTTEPKKPEEKRAVPVYHTDQRINNSVIAMMAMGFSNDGAWLTQLLESVNGNIAEALDIMSVAQRAGR